MSLPVGLRLSRRTRVILLIATTQLVFTQQANFRYSYVSLAVYHYALQGTKTPIRCS